MKAEPDPRVVKGKDVKVHRFDSGVRTASAHIEPSQFSVDDFESVRTTGWEGVRNHEAKNLMKEMKLGDKVMARSGSLQHRIEKNTSFQVLFYHSNCKLPGEHTQ